MKKTYLIVILLGFYIGYSQEDQNLKLWYNQPSDNKWENALPIGNGFLGAMVYGNVEHEIIHLNEGTVWSGGPNKNDNPNALATLPEIQKMIFEGKHKDAEKLANQAFISKQSQGQMFQPVGNLNLDFTGHEKFSNYRRELDIEKAITSTSYVVHGVTYSREAFVSFADRVIVIHLKASKKGSISFILRLIKRKILQ
jgi:alpha-L-fucosidase 2